MQKNYTDLVRGMLAGSKLSFSKLLTLVENNIEVPDIMTMASPHLGHAYKVGITGAPGVGKSSLVNALTTVAISKGASIGIIATDPSSPFHGGAVLGDRIRMQQHFLNERVFIRSVATRGSQSGLPVCIENIVKLFDAFGTDIILIETVGIGQTQTSISEVADTTILILTPDCGDTIQFMKAGVLEIADIIVVNKADHFHAQDIIDELKSIMLFNPDNKNKTPVIATQAINNVGIGELYQELENLRRTLKSTEKPLN